jgi:hypothetical protein
MQKGVAVGSQLQKRHIKDGVKCIFCAREESTIHRFWTCPYSRDVWREVEMACGNKLPRPSDDRQTAWTIKWWMLDALQTMKENAAQIFLTTLYEIWEARNAAVHEDTLNSPVSVAQKIHHLLHEWANLHQHDIQTNVRPSIGWSKPPRGWIKVNSRTKDRRMWSYPSEP